MNNGLFNLNIKVQNSKKTLQKNKLRLKQNQTSELDIQANRITNGTV